MSNEILVSTPGVGEYKITVENGILNKAGKLTKPLTTAKKVAVVTDSNVAPLYLKRAIDSYRTAGFEVYSFSFTAGEASKTFETVKNILEFFCLIHLTRKDIAVALGGGVVGDMVGFASAIYLRGIDFVQLPTTLLSQVDSSVGGKTGCDLPAGKNLCGAFHNPIAVFIDPETLETLPEMYLKDGYSEAIKSGAILVPELFELFENGEAMKNLNEVILQSVYMKSGVVQRDFTEKGERMFLNFGHTIGHAIERCENFSGLTHGQAVAVGMSVITKASEKAGLTKAGTYDRIVKCLKAHNLPTEVDFDLCRVIEFCKSDKKSVSDSLNLVILEDIGKAKIFPLSFSKLEAFILKGVL